ncbi:hypothetical protein GCM10008967_38910 [Bacillus carboniphilus]|uniref:Uncharacterized protein n=1 Tax=Bacillus carboniphilus TaxID=86663 RepID=A0ABP3GII9_9BACI
MKKWFAALALVFALVSVAGGQAFADQADHPDPTSGPTVKF